MPEIDLFPEEVVIIRNYIEKECGIALGDHKDYLIKNRLKRLILENGCYTFTEFYWKLINNQNNRLRDKVIDAITINETSWFRDYHLWIVFYKQVIPTLYELFKTDVNIHIRIWSAACSTGQEPYTVAMLIHEFVKQNNIMRPFIQSIRIFATDISDSALKIARLGQYDAISMNRGFTGEWGTFRNKYFTRKGNSSIISDEIRKMVTFLKFNLQDNFSHLGNFHVLLIRNVSIYFSDSFKRDLFNRIANNIVAPGYVFLGTAESIMISSPRFHTQKDGDVYYYVCK